MLLHPVPEEIIKEFRGRALDIIGKRPVKIWLAQRAGHRVDTLVSIGTSQSKPTRIFDHGAGFYLLGENVTPDLVSPFHSAFHQFCEKFVLAKKSGLVHRMDVRYRSARDSEAYWYNRLVMHYPFSAPVGGQSESEPV